MKSLPANVARKPLNIARGHSAETPLMIQLQTMFIGPIDEDLGDL